MAIDTFNIFNLLIKYFSKKVTQILNVFEDYIFLKFSFVQRASHAHFDYVTS